MQKKLAIVGTAVVLAIFALAACSSASDPDAPNSAQSGAASPGAVVINMEPFKLSLVTDQPPPAEWPDVPAPANSTLLGSGTATSELDDETWLAAAYRVKGKPAVVQAALAKQMKSAGWSGAELGNRVQAFEKGSANAVVKVDTESTGETTVFQVASTD